MDESGNAEESYQQFLANKYGIIETSYSEKDLGELKELVAELLDKNSHYNSDWLDHDNLIRFLRANGSVSKTMKALQSYCEWRFNENIDGISIETKGVREEENVGRTVLIDNVTDRCGQIVCVVHVRLHDKTVSNYENLYNWLYYLNEKLSKLCEKTRTKQYVTVFDLNGFSMRNMDYKLVKKVLHLFEHCYPERDAVSLIINYPWIFYGCWRIIRVWLNETMKSKFIFADEAILNDFIDLEKFPIKFF